ncbi:MAG: hypothetical protein AB1758_12090, partial [Candidatus Eremiobacterota bacterium]
MTPISDKEIICWVPTGDGRGAPVYEGDPLPVGCGDEPAKPERGASASDTLDLEPEDSYEPSSGESEVEQLRREQQDM